MGEAAHPDWLQPDWQVPGVGALMTTRRGGASCGAFDSMNLRDGLGDEPAAVADNRARLAAAMGARPVYLNQVHGSGVVRLTGASPRAVPMADASLTTERGVACVIQVADCLPVLFAVPGERGVAAAHAGWRGLSLGVLETTLAALCEASDCEAAEVQAWLGPCIGPRRFEVGPEVLEAFGADPRRGDQRGFRAHAQGKWMADLAGLARDRLAAAGVNAISGGRWCTVEDASRFFSFRRDRVTGRMVAAVWLDAGR
jgi:polyphenol oxidase